MYGALTYVYNELDVKCKFESCDKYLKLDMLEKHEATCQEKRCKNYEVCEHNGDLVIDFKVAF